LKEEDSPATETKIAETAESVDGQEEPVSNAQEKVKENVKKEETQQSSKKSQIISSDDIDQVFGDFDINYGEKVTAAL